MAKHLPYLIVGGAIAEFGVVFLLLGWMYGLFSLLPISGTIPAQVIWGCYLAGGITAAIGGILFLIGLVKYRNRFKMKM